jgi:tetratricopeptide repeat protein
MCIAALTAMCVAHCPPAGAQTSGRTEDPMVLLATPPDAESYYAASAEAKRLIDEKGWAEAETLLRRLTTDYPLDTAFAARHSNWGRLAQALREQGKCAEAIEAYRKVIELQGPGLPYAAEPSNARYWIAACYVALGRRNEALATLERMLKEDRFVARPDLLDDPNFAALKRDPRFQTIAGKAASAHLPLAEQWRHDIDHLISEAGRSNPAGSELPAEFLERARALRAHVGRLNDHQIVMGISQAMGALDRGHTAIWFGAAGGGTKIEFRPIPIRLYAFPEGIFITEAQAPHRELAGSQVLKFGTTAALEALTQVGLARSNESPMEVLRTGPQLLVRPGVLKGLGIVPEADRATLTLKLPDGRIVARTLAVVDEQRPTSWSRRLNPPPAAEPQLFLQNLTENHWFRLLPERDAIYIALNNMIPDEGESLQDFGLRLRRTLAERRPKNLIVDLRHNNGGNSFAYIELLRTLVAFSSEDGNRVYAIIGRGIYSAAANFTTDLERLVRPIFVGEPSSGTGNQWGDESRFVLPYSRIVGAFSGTRWQLSHPWDMRRSVVPHVPVQMKAADYFAGRDPVLEAVFRLIAATGQSQDAKLKR